MDEDFLELNTESDTTLEQPDLDQLRQDRLDRNRKFLQSVSGSTAARVLSQDGSTVTIDARESAAITIQKNWKRFMARNIYVTMLYEKYMKEEEEQRKKMKQQMEEGELLVENHELEVLLDDNKTTRRNAERLLISKVITIQRWWKATLDRKKTEHLIQDDGNDSNGKDDEIQGHTNDPVTNLHGNTRSSPRSEHRNPGSEESHKNSKTGLLAENIGNDYGDDVDDSCFINPVCDNTSGISTSGDSVVLKQLPRETVEDYQRRVRKQSLLSQAHQFIQLKKANSNVLPFNLHIQDVDSGSTTVPSCNHTVRMDDTASVSGECETCDLNRNSNKGNPIQTGGDISISGPNKEMGETGTRNKLVESKKGNPETKGGNLSNPNEKGDNKLSDESDCAFDVYNIETALPDLDWKTIEEKLIAARKEEDERLKARRNDREEIRKKLAMGADDDDDYDDNDDDDDDDISYKKPNLQSRLHSGLQICFMNESPGDTDSEGLSPRQHEIHDNMKLMSKADDIVDDDNNLKSVTDLNRTTPCTSQDKSSTPPRLKDKTLSDQASTSGGFQSRQEQLQEEAKLALAQAGTMARMQLEIEKQTQKKSPMAEMIGIPGLGERRRKKLSVRKLQEMNLASIQVLYNDLQTQIENLNEELVHLLMERDELHMEQDSMLVDIEDLTRRAEELAEKSNAKSAAKNSKNHVTGKVGGR